MKGTLLHCSLRSAGLVFLSLSMARVAGAQIDPGAAAAAPRKTIGPVPAQATLAALLGGELAPLSVQLRDLGPEWCHTNYSTASASAGNSIAIIAGTSNVSAETLYTRGETVTIAGTRFLAGYRLNIRQTGFLEMSIGLGRGAPIRQVTPETGLSFTLVSLNQLASLGDMRPFLLEREIREAMAPAEAFERMMAAREGDQPNRAPREAPAPAPPQPADETQSATLRNLALVGQALVQYAREHGNRLPPLTDSKTLRKYLTGYLANEAALVSPVTEEPYQPNERLSNLELNRIEKRPQVVLASETKAHKDGRRAVLFADFHIELVTDGAFAKLRLEGIVPDAHP